MSKLRFSSGLSDQQQTILSILESTKEMILSLSSEGAKQAALIGVIEQHSDSLRKKDEVPAFFDEDLFQVLTILTDQAIVDGRPEFAEDLFRQANIFLARVCIDERNYQRLTPFVSAHLTQFRKILTQQESLAGIERFQFDAQTMDRCIATMQRVQWAMWPALNAANAAGNVATERTVMADQLFEFSLAKAYLSNPKELQQCLGEVESFKARLAGKSPAKQVSGMLQACSLWKQYVPQETREFIEKLQDNRRDGDAATPEETEVSKTVISP